MKTKNHLTALLAKKRPIQNTLKISVLVTMIAGGIGNIPAAATSIFDFTTVVNNGYTIPNSDRNFNSYNQPSVNSDNLVVFRARSQGGQGQPITGIFTRNMVPISAPGPISSLFTRGSLVPDPNNTEAIFNEFPAFPRVDANSSTAATRGQSRPVWEYQVNGTDTRVGTSGIYTNPNNSVITGASQLGNVPGFSHFQVPGALSGTRFDQFPGSPSPTNGDIIVFKGNWTDTIGLQGETGVYFRDVVANGGEAPVQVIADSNTLIPNQNTVTFGSTAPPSAARGKAVFLGVDNEESPTLGGIYLSSLFNNPTDLQPIVAVGGLSDLVGNGGLKAIGEGLSFDGKYVGYWGAWGTETFSQIVSCRSEGNPGLLAYCLEQSEDPLKNGIGGGQFQFNVLKNQGFFVTNTETLETRLIARTDNEKEFATFLYWNFSGRAPSDTQEEAEELARWRTAAFIALDDSNAVFKGTKGSITQGFLDPTLDGIYTHRGEDNLLLTVAETGMNGSVLDSEATGLPIVSLGIERDGYRNGWLALTASMANEEESWAGVYITPTAVPEPSSLLAILIPGIALRLNFPSKR